MCLIYRSHSLHSFIHNHYCLTHHSPSFFSNSTSPHDNFYPNPAEPFFLNLLTILLPLPPRAVPGFISKLIIIWQKVPLKYYTSIDNILHHGHILSVPLHPLVYVYPSSRGTYCNQGKKGLAPSIHLKLLHPCPARNTDLSRFSRVLQKVDKPN